VHLLKRSGGDEPGVQRSATNAKRVVGALLEAGAVAINGNRKNANAQFGHERTILGAKNSSD
jgi:hypothetical protein